VFGMVGRFAPGKGHETLIPAFERFAAARPAARLLLIGGGGSEEEPIRRLAAATRVADRIHFTGHRDDLPVCYQAMDLLVFASLHEGLSNAVLEAKACGVPTLAHPAVGNLEVLKDGHNCLLRELDTVEKFQSALEEAMSQPERLRGLGRVAREEALREFSLQRMVGNYQRLYEELSPPY
jgi:glycosyltransferase involved in cell wall biosynthesis